MAQELKQLRVKIFDELSKIVDPEINTTITELELIDEVDIDDNNIKVDLHLTSPFCILPYLDSKYQRYTRYVSSYA